MERKACLDARRLGLFAPDLYQAILTFQRINRFRLDYDPDGHVDPHDAALRLMNDLSAGPGPSSRGVPPQLDLLAKARLLTAIATSAWAPARRSWAPSSRHAMSGSPFPLEWLGETADLTALRFPVGF